MSTEVRNRAINPSASFLVQAPAGSGKTELLTRRILALLAVVDEPEEILALTFTRKAAAEMGSRVIDALSMEKPADTASHKMDTWQLADKALKHSKERGWNLPEHPARLRIMTLDSLTGSLARQLPLLSGLGDIPTPSEHSRAICREAAEQTLNRAMQKDSAAVETLLLHQDHNTSAVIELMTRMLENREQWLPCIATHGRETAALKTVIESNLADYLGFQIQACNALIPIDARTALPELIRAAGRELGDDPLIAFGSWPESDISDMRAWKIIANFLLTASAPQFRKSVDKRSGFPTTAKAEKQQMQALLSLLEGIPGLAEALHRLRSLPENAEFEPQQWQLAEALFELLPQAVIHLQSIFSSQGTADFTEIALRALEALNDSEGNPSDLLLKLDYRIQHILVDEFQDTSELQIRLLRCLTAGWQPDDGRTLFMVGDPMQSIYRFRKAEVGLFLQAADNEAELPPVTALNLERNFRSSPVIVDWVNSAFRHIFPAKQDAISGAIIHANAESALRHDGTVCVHLQTATEESDADDKTEADAVVMLVRQALAKGQRVGILARTRKHLHAIMPALNDAGIGHRAIKILPLNTRAEVRTLRALVRALLHPADRESWFTLLRAPCCGLTAAELFTLLHADARSVWEIMGDDQAVERLNPEAGARVVHLREALAPCMAMSGRIGVRELAAVGWQRLSMPSLIDETSRTNVETLLQLIDSLDENGRIDFALLDERIDTLFAAPDAGDAAAGVELLTMHGAKGLQWDMVILPGLGKPPKNSDQPLLAFTDAPMEGKPLFLMSPKAEMYGNNRFFDLVQSIEKEKERNELARLLYVACTRAETELHLLGHLSKKEEAAKGSLLEMVLKKKDCFGAQSIPIQAGSDMADIEVRQLMRMKHIPSALPLSVRQESHEPEYGWAGPEATPVGNALHAILQQVAERGVEQWRPADSEGAVTAMRRMLIGEGLSGALLESALKRCRAGLEKTVSSKMGAWILSGSHEDAHCEWEIWFEQEGLVRQRFIDRSFIDSDGSRWIIDYKTGSHEGSDLNSFLESEQQRYAPQLAGYRELLQKMEPGRRIRTALYFPAFDGWRELTL